MAQPAGGVNDQVSVGIYRSRAPALVVIYKSVQDRHLCMGVDLDVGRNSHRAQVRLPGVSQSGCCLHGQIFAPAISAFTTSLWIM
jgi:hypothetical protein